MPRETEILDDFLYAGGPALGHGDHAVEGFFGQNFCERGAHRSEGQSIAGEGSTDSAGIAVFEAVALKNHVRDFLGEAVGRAGESASDRLAEDEEVGVEVFGAGVAAGAGADGVRLVDDEQSAVLARELAQRMVVAGNGMHDANVGQGRLSQHAGYVAVSERLFKSGDIVEFHDARGHGRIDRWADVAASRSGSAIGMKRDESFIDRTVVTPIEDEDFCAAGNLAREANRETVSVGGSQRKLPVGQAEALLQFFGDKDGIFGGQHEGDAAFDLLLDGFGGGEGRMSGHGARVAEAEVHIAMAVDIVEVRALGVADNGWKSSSPLHHPVHGDAGEQRLLAALVNGFRFRALVDEALLLALGEGFQAVAVESRHDCGNQRLLGSGGAASIFFDSFAVKEPHDTKNRPQYKGLKDESVSVKRWLDFIHRIQCGIPGYMEDNGQDQILAAYKVESGQYQRDCDEAYKVYCEREQGHPQNQLIQCKVPDCPYSTHNRECTAQ